MPSNYFSSITVITKDSGLADTLSTALFCMSYEEGLELVEKLEGVEVLWIYKNGEQVKTDGLLAIENNNN
jgi:thiamine biosynthesis lipoprotein